MTDQLRFNNGKPKLSYIFSSHRAYLACWWLEKDDQFYVDTEIDAIVENLARFLGREDTTLSNLASAALSTLVLLEARLNPAFVYDFEQCLWRQVPNALKAVCAVYAFGERKYDRGNYRKGAPVSTYIDSALRHLLALEERDVESKLPHLAHAFWNIWIALDQPSWRDDRLPPVQEAPATPEESSPSDQLPSEPLQL